MRLLRDRRSSELCSCLAFLGPAAGANAKFKKRRLFSVTVAQLTTLNCCCEASLRSCFRNGGVNAHDSGDGGREAGISSVAEADGSSEPVDDGWNRAGNQQPYQVALSHSSRSRQARFLSKPIGSVISFSEMNGWRNGGITGS